MAQDDDDRLEGYLELTTELLCEATADGWFTWVTPRWTETIGWTEDELLGRPFLDLVHPADLSATEREAAALATPGAVSEAFENRYRCKDGTWRWLRWRARTKTDGSGIVALARDITPVKEATRQEVHSSKLLRLGEGLTGVGHWRVDLVQEQVYWSDQVFRIHGFEPGSFAPELATAINFYHPDDRFLVQRYVDEAIRALTPFDFELRLVRSDGEIRAVRSAGQVEQGDGGQAVAIFGVFQDLTDLRRREHDLARINADIEARNQELEARNQELELLSQNGDLFQSAETEGEIGEILSLLLPDLFPGLQGGMYVVQASRQSATLIAQFGDAKLAESIRPSDCWALRRGTRHRLEPHGHGLICRHHERVPLGGSRCLLMTAQGESIGLLTVTASENQAHRLEQVERVASAVGEQVALAVANVRLRERLQQQNTRDALTGLANRRYLDQEFKREIARARRHDQPLSVVILDIDHFKRFNDTMGHLEADDFLRRFGELCRTSFRPEDIVCRWGGEEFVIVLPNVGPDDAVRAAERLAAHNTDMQRAQRVKVTFSAGVACFPDHGTNGQELLRRADAALYQAKHSGRNRVCVAAPGPIATPA